MVVTNPRLITLLSEEQKADLASMEKQFAHHLEYTIGKNRFNLKNEDIYKALGHTIRDFLIDRLNVTHERYRNENPKRVFYFSLEFLMGRTLMNALINLGLYETIQVMLRGIGFELTDVLEFETDAGLGNGGLGRLAACFLDSMATLNVPGFGYGIRYDYGIFNQIIANGSQLEMPDHWDADGVPYEVVRSDISFSVGFFGHTETRVSGKGKIQHDWVPDETVLASAHDYPIPGFNTSTVNYLRLWAAKSSEEFNLDYFNHGDYMKAVQDKSISENISKVLYPNDTTEQGKVLRLKQQYFMVCASLQDILIQFRESTYNLKELPNYVAIQLNDTHPSIGIAELMRIFLDNEEMDWEPAWEVVTKVFSYTNHTVLPEALETWRVELFEKLLPRHLEIIYEINHRFLSEVRGKCVLSEEEIQQVSIIEEGHEKRIRMANLAVIGSYRVNGVAELHSELIKKTIFQAFTKVFPEKFNNKTNGITPRRWLLQSNPGLANLISKRIGNDFTTDLYKLKALESFVDDPDFQNDWRKVKQVAKEDLAKLIKSETGITIDPKSLIDVQIKRFHEYKRQLLNILRVIALYRRIKENPYRVVTPRTVIFGGKAAPGYYMAKLIIKLINNVAWVVNRDPDVADRLKVVFLPNYRVSLAERIIPGSNLSEQISTAGTEASGTSNMKFMLNGALTIGTLDGANVEILEEVGAENIYIFGLHTEEVFRLKEAGYQPADFIRRNEDLHRVLLMIRENLFSMGEPGIFGPIYDSLYYTDNYLLMADFDAYDETQNLVAKDYLDETTWTKKSILNVARSGKFSSDRTIREYAKDIWKVPLLDTVPPKTIYKLPQN
ncbi:glycogen/starch/alpha-glucan phosphorylase [Leptospira vanthielii]|uniref:Alpha-1,4 glucan phosphorylase n=1 Tax=Leptospira vanthielii serovar Holland str. Waz Holland = ATCC 700522 TaxID=1218591 RepID=N1W460_9LEPT|nr:glycogen/starch/alpha-glucan phosphorylase [Leptospira vanthielii]EMY68250.1 phosphorylase, glycogen/starch/alpha-glucan family [Leptospira vanthielii serovar Holland str. Waz Holland = ATCC 700522]